MVASSASICKASRTHTQQSWLLWYVLSNGPLMRSSATYLLVGVSQQSLSILTPPLPASRWWEILVDQQTPVWLALAEVFFDYFRLVFRLSSKVPMCMDIEETLAMNAPIQWLNGLQKIWYKQVILLSDCFYLANFIAPWIGRGFFGGKIFVNFMKMESLDFRNPKNLNKARLHKQYKPWWNLTLSSFHNINLFDCRSSLQQPMPWLWSTWKINFWREAWPAQRDLIQSWDNATRRTFTLLPFKKVAFASPSTRTTRFMTSTLRQPLHKAISALSSVSASNSALERKSARIGKAISRFWNHSMFLGLRAHHDGSSCIWNILGSTAFYLVYMHHIQRPQMMKLNNGGETWNKASRNVSDMYQEFLADANGHLGSIPSKAINTHQSEDQDRNGEIFHNFVLSQDTWIPSTFQEHQQGPGGTWLHPRGHYLRNDYIALPQCWRHLQVRSFVDAQVDLTLRHEDHRVAACEVQATGFASQTRGFGRALPKLHIPSTSTTRSLLADIGQSLPSIAWDLDVSHHDVALHSALQDGLRHRFAQVQKFPRKPSISEDTWALILRKKEVRKRLHSLSAQERHDTLRALFEAWKQGSTSPTWRMVSSSRQQLAYTLYHFQKLGKQVATALRDDDIRFFEQLAEDSQRASMEKDYSHIWQLVRRQLPRFKQRRDAKNPLKISALDGHWIPHFQELEAGRTISPVSLVHEFVERTQQNEPLPVDRADLPSISTLERNLRQAQPKKAPGPDGLQSETLNLGAVALAPAAWDLMIKVYFSQTEPLTWKSGKMIPIFKKGSTSDVTNYRGILLAPVLSKRFHSLLRKTLMSHLVLLRSPGQLGGFPHGEVLFGAQGLRLAAHVVSLHNRPSVALFLDLRNAFHHVIRELVCGQQQTNHFEFETLLQSLHQAGVDVRGLLQWTKLPGILDRTAAPPLLQRLVEEVHRDTFFGLPDHAELTKTARGSRPGSPIADALFHGLMLDVQHEVERILSEDPVHPHACRDIELENVPVTWADDVAILLVGRHNDDIIPMLQRVTEKILALFQRRGFQLNLKRGKTGAVISFKGPGSIEARRQLLLEENPGCLVRCGGKELRLHFSTTYLHLGSLYEMEGHLTAEVQRRIGIAMAAFQELKRGIFLNKNLQVAIRLQLYESLIATKLWFGCGAWSLLSPKLLQTLDTATLRMCRIIIGDACGQRLHLTDDDIRAQFSIPTARARLCKERLLYAARLYRHGPAFLHRLIDQQHDLCKVSWKHFLLEDLAWLQRVLPGDERWPREWAQLLQFWQQPGPAWQRIVHKAFKKHLKQETLMLEVQGWQIRCYQTWKEAGVKFAQDPFQSNLVERTHSCHCGQTFGSFRGLRVHQRHKHGYEAPEKALATSATCPICLRFFWTRKRMQQHLSYAPRTGKPNECYEMLRRLPADEQAQADETEIPPDLKHFHRKQALLVEGPYGVGQTQQQKDYEKTFAELETLEKQAIEEGLLLDPTPEQKAFWFATFETEVCLWLGRHYDLVLQDDNIQDQWIQVISEHEEDEQSLAVTCLYFWGQEEMSDYMSQWNDPEVYHYIEDAHTQLMAELEIPQIRQRRTALFHKAVFLQREAPMPEHAHRPIYQGPANPSERRARQLPVLQHFENQSEWRRQFTTLTACAFPPAPQIPLWHGLTSQPCFVLLHLFSGRRRLDDWHSHLSKIARDKGVVLICLSLDTANDGDLCNLHCRGVSWKQVAHLLESGRVAGLLSGAPCETYSEARHTPLPDNRGPRPLRSADRLWGLADLKWKELSQLQQGSSFSLQTHWAMLQLYKQGGLALSEHPGPPKKEERATIWLAETVKMVLQDKEAFHLHVVPQYLWGAPAVKATGLLALRLPNLRADMKTWQLDNPQKPEWQAIGVGSDGQFRTASLKEYPSRFSAGMAAAFVKGLLRAQKRQHVREVSAAIPESLPLSVEQWLQATWKATELVRDDATWLPDYQPQCADW